MNVWAPAAPPPSGGYPVYLFFPGGGWAFNPAYVYDGFFSVSSNDVIIAVAQYRLNVFGFLASDALRNDSTDGSAGNYGLADQRAALQFMATVARSFGGDPSRITIGGQSAGAASIASHLLTTSRTAGLFRAAIMESGGFSDWTLADNAGCASSSDILACLRALDTDAIVAASQNLTAGVQEWAPTVDGVEIAMDPRDALASGHVSDVPIMLGFNSQEGTLFNNASTSMNASDLGTEMNMAFGPNITAEVLPAYPMKTASLLQQQHRKSPLFVYYFVHELEFTKVLIDPFRPMGVFHGSELLPVLNYWFLMWGPGETELASLMSRYWARFVTDASPNGSADPTWPAFDASASVAQINMTAAGAVNVTTLRGGIRANECSKWWNITIPPQNIWG